MLAQNFKTPAELGIPAAAMDALIAVLRMLERDEFQHRRGIMRSTTKGIKSFKFFNMRAYRNHEDCGTVLCIKGAAEMVADMPVDGGQEVKFWGNKTEALDRLFLPHTRLGLQAEAITPHQAAIALRNYLTHGEPRWDEAMAYSPPLR